MKNLLKLLTLMLVLAVFLLPASPAQARGLSGALFDGKVIFGDNYTLASGDTLNGDLVVFGGNVTVEEDALVEGDMVVIGGNVTLDGIVEGTLVSIGGSTRMSETSIVEEDLVSVGGSLTRDSGAQVDGEVITNIPAPNIDIPDIPSPPDVPNVPEPPIPPNPFERFEVNAFFVIRILFFVIFVSGLAILTSLFLQSQIERVSQAIVGQPVITGSVGLLVGMLALPVLVILAITVILIPISILVSIALVLGWLFGLIAIGTEVGERFTRAINQTWAPPLVAGIGTFFTMVVLSGLIVIPCVGFLMALLVSMIGIGGVTLTLFGTVAYPRVVAPPADPENELVG